MENSDLDENTFDAAPAIIPPSDGRWFDHPAVIRLLDEVQVAASRNAQAAVVARWLRARSAKPSDAEPRRNKLIKWRLQRVLNFMSEHLSETLTLDDLARASGLSKMYFAAQFRAATGLRPHEYFLRYRIARAKILIENTAVPIVVIGGSVGFQTQAHFTTTFKRFIGCTPARWRATNKRMVVLSGGY